MHLTAYNGSKIPQFGTLDTAIRLDPQRKRCCKPSTDPWWYIVDTLGPAILGLPSCAKLGIVELDCSVNLWKRKLVQQKPTTEGRKVNQDLQHPNSPPLNTKEDLIKAYPDRFEGIGHFPGTYHITLCSDTKPVVHAPRKCPSGYVATGVMKN